MFLHYLQAIFGLTILNILILIFTLYYGIKPYVLYGCIGINAIVLADFAHYYKTQHNTIENSQWTTIPPID